MSAQESPTERSLVFAFDANFEAFKAKTFDVHACNAPRVSGCDVELVTLSTPRIVELLGVDLSKLYSDTQFLVPCKLEFSRFQSWVLVALAYAALGGRVDAYGCAPSCEAAATYGMLVTGVLAQAPEFSLYDMEDVVCALQEDDSTAVQLVLDIFDKDLSAFNAVMRTTVASAVAYVLRYTPEDLSAVWRVELAEPNGPLLRRVLWWLRLGMHDDDGFIKPQADLRWLIARY